MRGLISVAHFSLTLTRGLANGRRSAASLLYSRPWGKETTLGPGYRPARIFHAPFIPLLSYSERKPRLSAPHRGLGLRRPPPPPQGGLRRPSSARSLTAAPAPKETRPSPQKETSLSPGRAEVPQRREELPSTGRAHTDMPLTPHGPPVRSRSSSPSQAPSRAPPG